VKLNIDCIRDLLLCIEANTGYRKPASFIDTDLAQKTLDIFEPPKIWPYQKELLETYTNETIMYHFGYCLHARLLETDGHFGSREFLVFDLTPAGHELLGNIRDKTVFEKSKDIAVKVGVHALSGFSQLASRIGTHMLLGYLGTPT